MTDPFEHIDKLLHDAANDLRIPTETAQMIMTVAVVLSRQQTQIVELQARVEELEQRVTHNQQRHSDQAAELRRQIQKLTGVHGA